MSKLVITQGLPASGKTTWARRQQEANEGMWRINRDDLRAMVLPTWDHTDTTNEAILTSIQLDDTNLRPDTVKLLEEVANEVGADTHIEASFTNVHVEECVRRDALRRVGHVGEEVIRAMHAKYFTSGVTA